MRIDRIKSTFGEREVFSDVTYSRLVEVLDEWIATRSNNNALGVVCRAPSVLEVLRTYSCNGRNVAASLPDDYGFPRTETYPHARLFTDIESIARLWLNVAACVPLYTRRMLFAS